jgi:hypothetical protein
MSFRPFRAAASALAVVLLVALAACGDDPSGPDTRTDASLNVVLQAPTAPLLSATTKAAWIKRGAEQEIRLYYRPKLGETDSTEFLRLRFDQATLLARPNGTPIAVGDSVLVTVTVPDPSRFLVNLEPTGLRFSPADPAELRWRLAEKDDDLDDDGDVDATDSSLYTTLAVWRQETIGLPWTRLTSNLQVELDEIEADLLGFSNYVVAY